MITAQNYNAQITSLDLDNLPPVLRSTHDKLMSKGALNYYGKNEAITATIDTYLSKLNDFAKDTTPKGGGGTVSVVKPKHQEEPTPPTPKKQSKSKATLPKKTKAKTVKAKTVKVKSANRQSKKSTIVKPAAHTAVRTIKSPELVALTRIRNLGKKKQTHTSLSRFVTQMQNAIKAGKYVDHKALLSEVAGKLAKAIEDPQTSYTIDMAEATKDRVQKAIDGAKERLRVSFLAGVKKSNRKKH